ncbi:preprotein translocase subunit Tim44 [Hylemonella gracilis str. Niagara R]|uniref:Preprotein translocase subunit Tim44 n=1 Tax=Hylemonella gracilis str. Niagara R TaxID=1458275 RepID=A0A016XKG7_9BURK|nr:preprotein translocase subunit Tim44 [Hylemonella gracilis str. Niagara R]
MKRGGALALTLTLGLVLVLGPMDAEARRLGGGTSVGKQSGNVMRRDAPAQPPATTPAQSSSASQGGAASGGSPTAPASAATPASAAAVGAAAAPARRTGMGLLGGVAAGLGLAWLASSLGLGAAFGQFLLIALFVLLAFVALRFLLRPRAAASGPRNSYAFQGAGGAGVATIPSAYYPENVGNDASARPWEQGASTTVAGTGHGSVIGSALHGSAGEWSVPAGFDVESFLKVAKSNFIHLQAAWDKADMVTLRSMMTDDMLAEISAQLAERERLSGGEPNLTEVQMLQAQLLGIEDIGGEYMASVEFSGMVREDRHSGPSPFREVWNMTKPRDGSRGWLVAGVQALQ